ncbi:AAA family ATPase [Chryseolinea lacunae]|uniref:AAA family ATPase n=1 Tax=Chryseolinea lacunae TaxID=2801331 RepID=A0ABS1KPT3_9BACT|nr:AAA family ATPase [Chryseolinea lacunae]MBL0741465.1 AAA family ATPase [Chryseolinea lacunae]
MELIMIMGIPASGKSTFCKARLFNTHVRVSLDLLNTRNKQRQLMALCFAMQQRMVLDNTNVSAAERAAHITDAKTNGFAVKGYYFESRLADCLERNARREGKEKIDPVGVIAKHKELELPAFAEGFDELYYVTLTDNTFTINPWNNEV